jgi:hypothetical protein
MIAPNDGVVDAQAGAPTHGLWPGVLAQAIRFTVLK